MSRRDGSPDARTAPPSGDGARETCERCGSADLAWKKCKLVCNNCGTINKSCADL